MALASATLMLPAALSAQSIAPTRDELTRAQPTDLAPRPTLNIVGGIERSPCPLANPRYADVHVTIRDVQFNNLKGATPDDMRAAWSPFAGTEQPVSVLCEIRDAAATILRAKGYLSAVQVPTQRIENGVVQMETLFARVVTVRARGQTDGAEAKLAQYLSKLTEDEYFDRDRAERYLLLARDLGRLDEATASFPKTSHPFYWAAFIILGDGAKPLVPLQQASVGAPAKGR